MEKKNTIKIIGIGLVIVLVIGTLLIVRFSKIKNSMAPIGKVDCSVKLTKDTVHGVSMESTIHNGQEIAVAEGYYNCNPIKRGDIVIYSYSKNREPLIKRVVGIEGDRLALTNIGGKSLILINGSAAQNMAGKIYELPADKTKMLQLYIKDYNGVIPKRSLLLLGNEINGSFDSTSIGLVDIGGLVGKVVEY